MRRKINNVLENDGFHMNEIIEGSRCPKHKVDAGEPCYTIRPAASSGRDIYRAVCGRRIKLFGYNGRITASSLSQTKKPAAHRQRTSR